MASLAGSALRSGQVASCSSSTRRFPPFTSGGRRAVVLRAEGDAAQAAAIVVDSKAPPMVTWPTDNESIKDVFAFSGPLPERLNGRMAMLGFAGIASTELSSQVPALEQLGNDWFGVTLLAVSLTLASVFPKIVSGSSLADLHATATSENLKGEGIGGALALFDTNVELWTGRLAMIGCAGLVVLEALQDKPLF